MIKELSDLEVPSSVTIPAVVPMVVIPPEGLIQFILSHSNKLVGFVPVFENLDADPDMASLASKTTIQRIEIPNTMSRSGSNIIH